MGWSFGFLRISKVLQTPLGAKLAWRAEQAKFRLGECASYVRGPLSSGGLLLAALAAPFLYSGAKAAYMSRRLRKLDQQEILSDRFAWLHERMLEDEVERALLREGEVRFRHFDKSKPELVLGPSYV